MPRKKKKKPSTSFEHLTMDKTPRGVALWILQGHVIQYGKIEKQEDSR